MYTCALCACQHARLYNLERKYEMTKAMAKTLRFKKNEEKALYIKCRELNKQLINNDFAPISESELAHIILDKMVNKARINTRGEIVFD